MNSVRGFNNRVPVNCFNIKVNHGSLLTGQPRNHRAATHLGQHLHVEPRILAGAAVSAPAGAAAVNPQRAELPGPRPGHYPGIRVTLPFFVPGEDAEASFPAAAAVAESTADAAGVTAVHLCALSQQSQVHQGHSGAPAQHPEHPHEGHRNGRRPHREHHGD